MKTVLKIAKSILIYFLCYICINFLFSLIYYRTELNNHLSFYKVFIYSLAKILNTEIAENRTLVFLSVQEFIEMICSAVLTGYIFAYILNRKPQIILPDKLIVRHRTSENVRNQLSLGIIVENKSRFKVYDVQCIVHCFYLKNKKEPILTNGEFEIAQEVHVIDNYFRFSFELEKFPRKILKDFISKNSTCLEIDSITVSVSGHSNKLGNTFLISKKYKLTDLIIDEHVPQVKYKVRNPFTKKAKWEFVIWNKINQVEEVSEKKRMKTINEIKKIIKNKAANE